MYNNSVLASNVPGAHFATGTVSLSDFDAAVVGDGATYYWKLIEPFGGGPTAVDSIDTNPPTQAQSQTLSLPDAPSPQPKQEHIITKKFIATESAFAASILFDGLTTQIGSEQGRCVESNSWFVQYRTVRVSHPEPGVVWMMQRRAYFQPGKYYAVNGAIFAGVTVTEYILLRKHHPRLATLVSGAGAYETVEHTYLASRWLAQCY